MEEIAHLSNAAASYDLIESMGAPADPISFPESRIFRCSRVQALVYDPNTLTERLLYNVVYRELVAQTKLPFRAYFIGRKLRKAIYGCVRLTSVLHLRDRDRMVWELTGQLVAVKIIDWNMIRQMRNKRMEDPIKEIECLQYISNYGDELHPNVIGSLEVFCDELYIYSFMPFCLGGELFTHVERDGRFTEPVARFWFHQVLQGLYQLQRKGVCHRDLSLENLMVDERTNCLIIDMGMCVRVPYSSRDGSICDVSAGTLRRLIRPQGACGKPVYVSPEVLSNIEPFDGFAVDLWAAGVVLFIMLVGLPPWEFAHESDPRFNMICQGSLMSLLNQWRRAISPDAGDLLQKMFQKDARRRLSLIEVMGHKWVTSGNISPPPLNPIIGCEQN
jgi:serine/threonine protein kinase